MHMYFKLCTTSFLRIHRKKLFPGYKNGITKFFFLLTEIIPNCRKEGFISDFSLAAQNTDGFNVRYIGSITQAVKYLVHVSKSIVF